MVWADGIYINVVTLVQKHVFYRWLALDLEEPHEQVIIAVYAESSGMAIKTETRLGPYEIVSAIGAGGMGEVYRARDPRLKREVAIKVLPASFSSDPQWLHRFEQEAIAAGALNHPNILAVHDIGQQDGSPYIVSELLDGTTLRERLRSGPLPIRKAVDYAQQIASGLAAAHDKRIIHRDLKPENIFITNDGRVKILDFGLAKLTRSEGNEDGEPFTQTMQSDPGTVLGTVGYMSPEQVRGKPADARSDLFSFGAILYEMLSGKRAFHGESPAETMSAIAKEEPPELTETNRNVPPALERIVRHCVEKNAAERFQSARDVAFALENISQSSRSAAVPAVPRSHFASSLKPVLWGVSLLAVALAVFLAERTWRRWVAPTFHRLTFERGMISSARFAPDGHSVIYSASWESKPFRVFSTAADAPQSRPLEVDSAALLGISRSGEMALALGGKVTHHVVFRDATLARAPLAGGAPREVLEDVTAADWAPDGTLAVVHHVGGRTRLEYPIGKVLYETSGWIDGIRLSPAGDRIAFQLHPFWPDSRGFIAVVDLAGNERNLSQEWEGASGLAWSPKGEEIWFTAALGGTGNVLYAVTLSGKQRRLLDIPGGLSLHDISPDGHILVTFDNERVGMRGSRDGAAERELTWLGWTVATAISPDHKWLLFNEQAEPTGTNYWVAIRGFDGSAPVRLGDGIPGGFSPDGKWVTAHLPSQGQRVTLLPTGAGQPREIAISGLEQIYFAAFLPDEKRLILIGAEPGHAVRTFIVDIGGGKPMPLTPEGIGSIVVSADGRYVAAQDTAKNITVYPLDGGTARTIQGAVGMTPVQWSTEGRSLFATVSDEAPARVLRIDVTTGRQELVRRLLPGDSAGVYQVRNVRLTPDGKTYAYGYAQRLSQLYVVDGLR